jgi:3-oxoacyl-[acyl-carrier-protein] synthase I
MTRLADDIVLGGFGALTALGATAALSAASIRANISRQAGHPLAQDDYGKDIVVARATYVSDTCHGLDRLLAFAIPALEQALHFAANESVPLYVGLPALRPGVAADLAAKIVKALRASLPLTAVHHFSNGHAAGLLALERACAEIRRGAIELCVVGGVDSYIDPATLDWLLSQRRIRSARCLSAFVPGEGACFCIVGKRSALTRLEVPILAKVTAIASAREEISLRDDAVCTGAGLTAAIKPVLVGLPGKITDTICDLNGERHRTDEYGFTLTRLAARFADPSRFAAPSTQWGDVGAASAPLFVLLAATAHQRAYAHGPLTLVWASSDDGARGAALISAASAEPTGRA